MNGNSGIGDAWEKTLPDSPGKSASGYKIYKRNTFILRIILIIILSYHPGLRHGAYTCQSSTSRLPPSSCYTYTHTNLEAPPPAPVLPAFPSISPIVLSVHSHNAFNGSPHT
jgi:hypothetical protein